MKKLWYLFGGLLLIVGLNMAPQFAGLNKDPVAVGPVKIEREKFEVPFYCHLAGAPAGYNYYGWPFVSYGPDHDCRADRSIYIGNIIINAVVAVGVVAVVWVTIESIHKRRKR